MKDRIRKLRKMLDLTQREFAERIGMKSNTIATYEMGRAFPSDPTINNICKEFDVNETWLRTGEGEMFVPKATDALDALAKERGLTHGDYIVIEKFLSLKPEIRAGLVDYFTEVAAALISGDVDAGSPAVPGASIVEAEALYEKSLGSAPSTDSSASNTTGGAGPVSKASGST